MGLDTFHPFTYPNMKNKREEQKPKRIDIKIITTKNFFVINERRKWGFKNVNEIKLRHKFVEVTSGVSHSNKGKDEKRKGT